MELNKKINAIFSKLDDLLYENKFTEVEKILNETDLKDTDPILLVSLLSVTDQWKKYISNRSDFYIKVERIVQDKYDKKTAKELLFDLK